MLPHRTRLYLVLPCRINEALKRFNSLKSAHLMQSAVFFDCEECSDALGQLAIDGHGEDLFYSIAIATKYNRIVRCGLHAHKLVLITLL